MQYNQPYGAATNAGFVNGDPSVGRAGSIPPAESMEYPQREIVAVIQHAHDSGFADFNNVACGSPSNTDLNQLEKAIWGMINSLRLTVPKTLYVNTTTGNDLNDGKTTGTAVKTLNRAAYLANLFNLNGFTVTVNVADGTYGQVRLPPLNGSGSISFVGNTGSPSNCIIHSTLGPAIVAYGYGYGFTGFKLMADATDTARQEPGAGVWSPPPGMVGITNCEFGACADAHMSANGGVIVFGGTITVTGPTAAHVGVSNRGLVYATGTPLPSLVIIGNPSVGVWAAASGSGSNADVYYSAITGTAVGQKYSADLNAVVNTGTANANYLPGTTAGAVGRGGQYA